MQAKASSFQTKCHGTWFLGCGFARLNRTVFVLARVPVPGRDKEEALPGANSQEETGSTS